MVVTVQSPLPYMDYIWKQELKLSLLIINLNTVKACLDTLLYIDATFL